MRGPGRSGDLRRARGRGVRGHLRDTGPPLSSQTAVEIRVHKARSAPRRVVMVAVVVTMLASTGCNWPTGDWPTAQPRLYRNNGGYVPNPVNHDFGSGGP